MPRSIVVERVQGLPETVRLDIDSGRCSPAHDSPEVPTHGTLTYGHDLDAETTTFTADDRTITYPAWWRGDITCEPLVPEPDELEDWLAHAMAVKSDQALQATLLEGWA